MKYKGKTMDEILAKKRKMLRGVGDTLGTDPHKRMLKKSKRLGKKFDYGGKMFSAEAWKND